ncbi:hypothetical protein DIPPA_70165 [Diplonema papillatum]|nr:hypothetical protein DIPPA_70166 [Diplonema papillatum]KAJ9472696.1 hypothetical protein DIPPA_70165 [Diplonema papillatum]
MSTKLARTLKQAATASQARRVGFASSNFRAAFGDNPPTPDKAPYQAAALKKLAELDTEKWYSDPVQTVINGKVVEGGNTIPTKSAFFEENGKIVQGDSAVLQQLKEHMKSINTTQHDYRKAIREIEDKFTTTLAGDLMANQAVDFMKQDGFTEIEEWQQAGCVERKLNDFLLGDELGGTIDIIREPAFVGCVSNFSNFLDLSRKVLRNLELGVPVVVLSRTNTTQHMYRWFQMLIKLMEEHGVPLDLATYASLDVAGQRELLSSCPKSPMYFTGSREVAAALKEVAPNLMAATSGPNTMVVTEMSPAAKDAIRLSSIIENSGQCTHLRHLVAPAVTGADIESAYEGTNIIDGPADAIKSGFRSDGMFKGHPTTAGTDSSYTKHPTLPVAYVVRDGEFPADTIDEKWRQSFLDVTSVSSKEKLSDPAFINDLADWLVRNGPITLAVNGDEKIARELFEKSSMTTYTVGDHTKAALTVSARPQEYESFGEFPARPTLSKYTKFPVLVPSSTPSYHSSYTEKYLQQSATQTVPKSLQALKDAASNDLTKGYIQVAFNFLKDACGPRGNIHHKHARTAIAGWQRPPLNGQPSVLRADKDTSADALAVYIAPYLATNAKECLVVSVDPSNKKCVELVEKLALANTTVEDEAAFTSRKWDRTPYNIQYPTYDGHPNGGGAPLMSPFLALLFPVGHVKCLVPNDQEFLNRWSTSKKWLSVVSA